MIVRSPSTCGNCERANPSPWLPKIDMCHEHRRYRERAHSVPGAVAVPQSGNSRPRRKHHRILSDHSSFAAQAFESVDVVVPDRFDPRFITHDRLVIGERDAGEAVEHDDRLPATRRLSRSKNGHRAQIGELRLDRPGDDHRMIVEARYENRTKSIAGSRLSSGLWCQAMVRPVLGCNEI